MVSCSECKHSIKDPLSLLPDEGWFKARCRVSPKSMFADNGENPYLRKFKLCRDMNHDGECKQFDIK